MKDLLQYVGLIKQTYYNWIKKFDRPNPDQAIETQLLELREQHPNYGYRRLWAELCKLGYVISENKTQKLCQKLGIQVTCFGHRNRKYKSYKGEVGKVASNRIRRRFKTSIPHQKITTDTTEFKYYGYDSMGIPRIKKLYLNLFLDKYNSEIVSYSISKQPTFKPIMEALAQAIEQTNDCPFRRTFHSDQSWAYQMKPYVNTLKDQKIFQSMSRKGNCLDNAIMENFFGILKQEIYYGHMFNSYEELKQTIEDYIRYYNNERIKKKLDFMSPVEYRIKHAA